MSTESVSRLKQPVDTVKHVFVLYKLATVGLLEAFLHSGGETGLIFEHPGNGVFHDLLGVLAVGKGQLLEPRFNVGQDMYFHTLPWYAKTGLEAIICRRLPSRDR